MAAYQRNRHQEQQQPLTREERERQIQEIDNVSKALISFGVKTVKKNPIIFSSYFIGLLLCILFTGFKVSNNQISTYHKTIQSIDYDNLYKLENEYFYYNQLYTNSLSWFYFCNTKQCKNNKINRDVAYNNYINEVNKEKQLLSKAKKEVGILSIYGIQETRDLYWKRFAQGRGFAQRQSKWDALFLGLQAMSRDESLMEYLFRVLINVILNFTIGTIGATIGFIFSLYSLIITYQANIIIGLTYFTLASLAAISFAVTWLFGMYAAAAGTVYVGAKVMASSLRIENERNHRVA